MTEIARPDRRAPDRRLRGGRLRGARRGRGRRGAQGPRTPARSGRLLERGVIPVIVDPEAAVRLELQPDLLVDAIVAKRNPGTRIDDAPAVVALGPGLLGRARRARGDRDQARPHAGPRDLRGRGACRHRRARGRRRLRRGARAALSGRGRLPQRPRDRRSGEPRRRRGTRRRRPRLLAAGRGAARSAAFGTGGDGRLQGGRRRSPSEPGALLHGLGQGAGHRRRCARGRVLPAGGRAVRGRDTGCEHSKEVRSEVLQHTDKGRAPRRGALLRRQGGRRRPDHRRRGPRARGQGHRRRGRAPTAPIRWSPTSPITSASAWPPWPCRWSRRRRWRRP